MMMMVEKRGKVLRNLSSSNAAFTEVVSPGHARIAISATIDETRYTLCTVTRVLVETFSCALIGYTTVPFLLLAVPLRHSIKPASCPLVHFDLACPHFGVTPPDREYPPTLSSLHHPQPP